VPLIFIVIDLCMTHGKDLRWWWDLSTVEQEYYLAWFLAKKDWENYQIEQATKR
jgi:hypothetical protein